MPDMCLFEKKEKEGFFRLPTFFFRHKLLFPRNNFVQFFMYYNAKKFFGAIQKNFFLKIYLAFLEKKKNFKNFRIAPKFFFAL